MTPPLTWTHPGTSCRRSLLLRPPSTTTQMFRHARGRPVSVTASGSGNALASSIHPNGMWHLWLPRHQWRALRTAERAALKAWRGAQWQLPTPAVEERAIAVQGRRCSSSRPSAPPRSELGGRPLPVRGRRDLGWTTGSKAGTPSGTRAPATLRRSDRTRNAGGASPCASLLVGRAPHTAGQGHDDRPGRETRSPKRSQYIY